MLCPECGCDLYQLEDSLLHSPVDSEDFRLATFILNNCQKCTELITELLQQRIDIMNELQRIFKRKEG